MLFSVYCKATAAQVNSPQTKQKEILSTKEGVSEQLLNEYESIIAKYRIINDKGLTQYGRFSNEERIRLAEIYKAMSKEQQEQQVMHFVVVPMRSKMHITDAQLKSWSNSKTYGVWVDGKRVNDGQLANYKAIEFDHVFVSKLSKTAINYGKHYYQVDLMTKEGYATYAKEYEQGPPLIIGVPKKAKQSKK